MARRTRNSRCATTSRICIWGAPISANISRSSARKWLLSWLTSAHPRSRERTPQRPSHFFSRKLRLEAGRASLDLGARLLHDLTPLRDFDLHESAHVGRAVADELRSACRERFAHVRQLDDAHD